MFSISARISRNNLLKIHQRFLISTHSFASKSSKKLQKSKKTSESEFEPHYLNSLFNEICGILNSENARNVEKQSGFSLLLEKIEGDGNVVEKTPCTQSVCENAKENEELVCSNDKKVGVLGGSDVSPMVHKITEVVRDENDAVSMEERLESAGLEYNAEIVEMVLKRCFKVPRLALRFFEWVKSVDGFCHSTETYNAMINMAAELKDFGLVDELLEEMEKSSIEKNVKTWSIIISHCGTEKLIGKALLVFENMKKHGLEPDTSAHKIMLNSLCNAGKADIAFEFYKEMIDQGMMLDERLFQKLLKCSAVSGDIVAVLKIGNDMMTTSEISEHTVYGLMLKSLCFAGRIRKSLELIREMTNKNLSFDSENFETLVKGLCRADRITDALEIAEITKKRGANNANLYEIIAFAYLKKNKFSKAFDLIQRVKYQGHLPTAATYKALMQHLFKANEFEKGVRLYNEMIERGVRLDCDEITSVVVGYIRQNRVSEAWGVFESMKDKGVNFSRKFYGLIIKELLEVSHNDDVAKFLKEIKASDVELRDDIFRQVKLKEIEPMQMNNVESNAAKSEPATKSFHRNDVSQISQMLSSSTDWCFVKEELEKCDTQFTPELVTEVLRNSRLNAGIALQFFSWVGKRTDYRHTTESYNMAIKVAGQAKDFKLMRSLFYEMRRKGCSTTSDTWTIMIMLYGRAGLTDSALRTFQEMKDGGDQKPNESTYKFLTISLCGEKGRNIDEAIRLFNEMIQIGLSPDKELLEAYISSLCEVGKLGHARSCIETLQKIGFAVPLSYSLYIRSLCRVGKLEEALGLIDEVDDDDDRNTLAKYTYGSIIHGLLQRGDLKAALAKIESLKQLGICPNIHTYTSLIVYYFKENQIEQVSRCLDEMRDSGIEPTLVTYSALMRGYANIGMITGAWNIFRHMKQHGPLPDFRTYSIFISCLCQIGESEQALGLVSEMMNDGIVPSAVNFRTVFFGLNREGKHRLAQSVLKKKYDLKRTRTLSM